MKYCSKCGQSIEDGYTYCPNCGKGVGLSYERQINTTSNIQNNGTNAQKQQPKRESFIAFTMIFIIVAVLTTIFMLVPGYFVFEQYYYYRGGYSSYSYSFIEYMGGGSIIILLLLWSNPIIGFIEIKQKRSYSSIKLINSIVLFIIVLFVSLNDSDRCNFEPPFWLTMSFLFIYVILSIIPLVVSKKSAQSPIQNNTATRVEQQPITRNSRIFCRHCGVEMDEIQAICIKCGVSVGNGNSYCAHCGKEISENAEFCMHCGVAINGR